MSDIDQSEAKQVLSKLSILLKNGFLSKEQVLGVLEETVPQSSKDHSPRTKINLQKILYYIGGFIVLLGITIYFYQFWDSMDQVSKAILTLGSSVSSYALGYYFFSFSKSRDFGHAFLVISAALFPLGIGTTLDTIGISATRSGGVSVNSAVLFMIFFVSYSVLKAAIFLPFSIIAASTLFFSFTNFLFGGSVLIPHFYEYRFLILGATYILFGYYFFQTNRRFMTNLLYVSGLLMFLGAGMSLQGFFPRSDIFWQLFYPFLLVLTFWGSIKLQSKAFLIMATIFTFGEILKLTAEYFSNSIGWPVSLIFAGLIIMGVGYLSFELNKRFIKKLD
ncbi:MAG: hypothetical protein ACD_50C00152G0006 [uncultured bacterium]|nr:MAG: hypothetical protein ACD_50C00152G0006 [uncultured bacterium]OGH14886.1 MAG: hypothetical protein A2687_04540 [Candidatus Levybacteria bacterium RIFCSPHIGHO2_01_FULL_38_26]